jgi:3alpha(or 20beta)-hydroxysteroid dehydrogenase
VVLTDVLDDDGEKVAAELAQAGHDAHYRRLDVADPASWHAARAAVDERFGKLDILVNNAGIIHETTIADEDLTAWTQLLSVNLTGVFLGLQTMLPLLRKGTNPAVVNTSSVYGPSGAIGCAA